MTFTIPHPEPSTEQEAVENGLALLDHVDFDRHRVQNCVLDDLASFDMNDCQHCALGMTIGWVDALNLFETIFEQLGFKSQAEALRVFGFDGWTDTQMRHLQREWLDALGLTADYARVTSS